MQLRSFPVTDPPFLRPKFRVQTVQAAPPAWHSLLSFLKPQHWLLPMVAMFCGAGMAGPQILPPHDLTLLILGLTLVGPLLGGAGRAINAYFDRDVEADPDRPDPFGRLSADAIVATMGILSLLALLVAHHLGAFAFNVTALTLATHFALNAPPLRLRRQTWWNVVFYGIISLGGPWILGGALFNSLSENSIVLASLFGFGAVGLQLAGTLHRGLGERRAGLQTLAALLGPEIGAWIAALVIDTSLLGAAIVCLGAQALIASGGLLVLLLMQLGLQVAGFQQPASKRHAYATASVILYMAAMMLSVASMPPALPAL